MADDDRLRLLYELGCAFAARIDLDELSAFVVQQCREVLAADGASILLLDRDKNELYFPYVADADAEVADRLLRLRFPADRGIAGAVLRDGRALRIDDVAGDPRFYGAVDRKTGLTTRAMICAPLRTHQGTIGVLEVLNPRAAPHFTDDDVAFLDALAGSIAVAIDNARMVRQLREQYEALQTAMREHEQLLAMRRELDIARSIQASIVPRVFPPFPQRTEFELFAAMLPAREVGGDFYDFFLVDDRHLGLAIGDVSDKGVPAALFMAVTRTLLRSTALAGRPAGECLRRVNELLCLENAADMFVTIFYGILDVRTGELAYSNGGHNPPFVLRRDGSIQLLAGTGGTVLGALEDLSYRVENTTLAPGDGLFLYTDGVTEAMNAAAEQFTEAGLATVLRAHHDAAPEAIIGAVMRAVAEHAQAVAQSDDVTVLALRYLG